MNGYDPPATCGVNGCGGALWGEDGFCWTHDPQNREEVLENASRGGRGKGDPRLAALRTALQELYTEVKDNGFETTRANTLIRIVSVQIDIVKAERELTVDEVYAELDGLKEHLRDNGVLVS